MVVDGVNIKELDTEWLRTQMALVSQEPVLFSCSIGDSASRRCDVCVCVCFWCVCVCPN